MVTEYMERRGPRLRHAMAIQGEKVYVLVGPEETPFLVPRELLVWSSAVFKAMLKDHFKEGAEGVIKLKDVSTDVFAVFFVWLHHFDCFTIDKTIDDGLMYGLAIFAEQYQVQRLSNQVLDREASRKGWYPTDTSVRTIYKGTPPGSAIRRHAVVRVADTFKRQFDQDDESRERFRAKYNDSFTNCPDFITDFANFVIFSRIKDEEDKPCFYHNHSDIPDAKPSTDTTPCPYANRHALEAFEEHDLKYDEELVSRQHQLIKKARIIHENEQNAQKESIEEEKKKTEEQEMEDKEEVGAKRKRRKREEETDDEECGKGEKEVDQDEHSQHIATDGASMTGLT